MRRFARVVLQCCTSMAVFAIAISLLLIMNQRSIAYHPKDINVTSTVVRTVVAPPDKSCPLDIATCRADNCANGGGCVPNEDQTDCGGNCNTDHACCPDCNTCSKKANTNPMTCECKYVKP